MLKPTGFWSYSDSDDENSRGRLSQLRARLAAELQQQIGRNEKVNIFQDVAAIPPGGDWERQITEGLQTASFLIVILTPALLQSEWCCREISIFGKREASLRRGDLIFPIRYIDTSDIRPDNPNECFDKSVYQLIFRHQLIDFEPLRFKDFESEETSRKIASLAQAIKRTLRREASEDLRDLKAPKVDASQVETSRAASVAQETAPEVQNNSTSGFISTGYPVTGASNSAIKLKHILMMGVGVMWVVFGLILFSFTVLAFSDKTAPSGVGIFFAAAFAVYGFASYKMRPWFLNVWSSKKPPL
jgi:hypothetical protein